MHGSLIPKKQRYENQEIEVSLNYMGPSCNSNKNGDDAKNQLCTPIILDKTKACLRGTI